MMSLLAHSVPAGFGIAATIAGLAYAQHLRQDLARKRIKALYLEAWRICRRVLAAENTAPQWELFTCIAEFSRAFDRIFEVSPDVPRAREELSEGLKILAREVMRLEAYSITSSRDGSEHARRYSEAGGANPGKRA
jgi:hypothetical protein